MNRKNSQQAYNSKTTEPISHQACYMKPMNKKGKVQSNQNRRSKKTEFFTGNAKNKIGPLLGNVI